MFELLFEAVVLGAAITGLSPRGTRVALDTREQRLDLGDARVSAFLDGRRGRPRLVELGPELLRTGPVLGGFRGGDVDERLKIGGGTGGGIILLRELLLQAVDLGAALRSQILGGTGIALDAGEYGLDLRDPRIGALVRCLRIRPRLVQFALELVGATAVLGGFGGRDVDERLEVGGGRGSCVGLLLEVGFELGGPLTGLLGSGVRFVKVGLQSVGPVAVLGGFRGGDICERVKVG